MKILGDLKSNIFISLSFREIIDAFCTVYSKYDFNNFKYIFDSGIYEYTCDELFKISLICEYKDSNVLNRICVDIAFSPTKDNYEFSDNKHFTSLIDFKNYVINSKEFQVLKTKNILKVDIYQD